MCDSGRAVFVSDIGFVHTGAVFFWCHVIFFSEDSVKIRKIGNADTYGDFGDLHTGSDKKIGSDIQTIIIDIFNAGRTHIFFKETHKIMFAEVYLFCKFVNCNRLCIIFTDVIKNYFYISCSAVFDDGVTAAALKEVLEQYKKQSVKLRFDF